MAIEIAKLRNTKAAEEYLRTRAVHTAGTVSQQDSAVSIEFSYEKLWK